ncbi:hypothetical protein D1007_39308 [Hordeum vulgare]|nr:hypothetical protein D1007_39308 [Hordeum vulgare]
MVTSRTTRTHGYEMRPDEEDNNWDAPRYGDGLSASADMQLGGEVAMDDVAFVAVDFEEEDDEVDETERCSPYKKFDHRMAYTPSPGQPRARRGMSFSFGSAGSATNRGHIRSSGSSKLEEDPEIPTWVDAHNNFDMEETPGSAVADHTLAKEVDKMKLRLEKEKPECSKVQQMAKSFEEKAPVNGSIGVSKQRKKKSGVPKKLAEGRRPGNLVIRDEPIGSADMIPALRSLNSLGSSDSASVPMDYHDSVLGKRLVDGMLGFDLVADATNVVNNTLLELAWYFAARMARLSSPLAAIFAPVLPSSKRSLLPVRKESHLQELGACFL